MSAFASGLLTCGSALGSFLMKLTTGPILRRFGFRRVLIGNTIISAGSLLVCAFFSISTPVVLVFGLLLVVVMVFMPQGLWGMARRLVWKR